MTLALAYTRRWRLIMIGALAQTAGQCFGGDVYPVTSNAGELTLLISCTILVKLIQEDLGLAASFADFLHHSNLAFEQRSSSPKRHSLDGAEDSDILSNPSSRSASRASALGAILETSRDDDEDNGEVEMVSTSMVISDVQVSVQVMSQVDVAYQPVGTADGVSHDLEAPGPGDIGQDTASTSI
jgi:hypothetical protein